MKVHVSHSDDPLTADAISEILADLEDRLAGDEPRAALLFAGVEYEHDVLLQAIADRWPGLPLVGATTDGEISSELGFCEDSVVLSLFSGADVRVHAGIGTDLSAGIDAAVDAALEGAGDLKPRVCLTTFSASTNSSAVLRALSARLGEVRCPVVGGLSGDHREEATAKEFFGDRVCEDSFPLLLIEGEFEVSWGVGSGWEPSGPRLTVTSSEGHIVHTIDGSPALEAYERVYGATSDDRLGEHPVVLLHGDGSWSLRAVVSADRERGSLIFAGEVPEDATLRAAKVLVDGLLSGSAESLGLALERFTGDAPDVALVFTCAARKWVLGTDAPSEIDVLRGVAQDQGWVDLAIVGMYAFGEIAPGSETSSQFHNETCVSVVLGT